MKNFIVVANVFFGGAEEVASFDNKSDADAHCDSLFNPLDVYTSFTVEVKEEEGK